jgi:hypothetical protein
MNRLSRSAGLAAVVVAGLAVLAPGSASASPASRTAATAPAHRAHTATAVALNTKIANVHVRSLPRTSLGSKVVSTIAASGSPTQAVCYIASNSKYWIKIEAPAAGYVAARNLDFPRSNGSKVPAGMATCPA